MGDRDGGVVGEHPQPGELALNIFTNYFNKVARTEVDFPRVGLGVHAGQ